MSRLRRLVVSDRWFFVTCRLLPGRKILSDSEFARLARVIQERREEHRFLLTAWVFLTGMRFSSRGPLTISRVMEAFKDLATTRINPSRGEVGRLLEARFFDRALGTVEEYDEKVQYIHLNPVRAGLPRRPEAVARTTASVVRSFFNRRTADRKNGGPRYRLSVGRVLLPADAHTRI